METGGDGIKFPRVAQSRKYKEIQVKGSECEAGEDKAHLSGLNLGIGGDERIPRVAQASVDTSDEVNTLIAKTINKNQSVSDHYKRNANLSEALLECEKKIIVLNVEKIKNEYFKELTRCEEIDLQKFDLAEAIVLELIEKWLESEKD